MPRCVIGVALALTIIVAACGASNPARSEGTWMVDCVAVLGIPTPSGQMPLAAVPRSGLQRDERIGDLSDADLGRLADYAACIGSNGYRHDCCSDMYCPYTLPGDPPIGPFRLETTLPIADELSTCYASTQGTSSLPSREDDISLFRSNFAACHVGLYEDCQRENAAAPFGDGAWGPDCWEFNSLCGALK
ncbi:MAG: hypothetical protein ACREJ3_14660 [Polyangiaceae bacterium]